jgi:spermidine/putrescine transport system substrate-binding protein
MMGSPYSRRTILTAGAAGAMAATLSAPAILRAADRRLLVANWQGYGSDLPWVVEGFKKETGATVVHQYYDSEQAMLQLLRNGGVGQIDVALPNLMYIKPAVKGGLLEKLDTAKLTNYGSILPKLRETTLIDGEAFTVPYAWGSNELFYNAAMVKTPLDSWKALWEPQFAGRVAFVDDPTASIFIAALALGQDPYNPNLDEVTKSLMALKQNLKLLYSSGDDCIKAYLNNSVTVGEIYSDAAGRLSTQTPTIVGLSPKEGAIGWVDTWGIVKNAPSPDLAYAWLDYMTSLPFQLRWAETPTGSPIPTSGPAIKALPPALAKRMGADPSRLDNMVMQKDVPEDKLSDWLELWQTVKAS